MRNFFAKYITTRYMLMLVTLITGHQFLLAAAQAEFPIFPYTTESHVQPKTERELEAELEDRLAAGTESARLQAEKRAREEQKTDYEVREAGRRAVQDAEQRIRRDIARERAALLQAQADAKNNTQERSEKAGLEEKKGHAVSVVGSGPESQDGEQAKPVKLVPDTAPIALPSQEAGDKTEKVTDEAEYADVLQQQYADQKEKKSSELIVTFPDRLYFAHLPSRATEVAGNYARIRIGAYDFAFKMIDNAWTIEFVDAVYRYDPMGAILGAGSSGEKAGSQKDEK